MKTKKVKKSRIWELDFLRGIAILLVVYDHIMLTFGNFAHTFEATGRESLINLSLKGLKYWTSDIRLFWRPFFLFLFFFIAGICTAFSRNNFKRAFKIGLAAVAVSAGTFILENFILQESGYFVMFGILHCMTAIILIYAIVSTIVKYASKNNKYILAAVCSILGVVAVIMDKLYNLSVTEITLSSPPYIDTPHQWLGLFIYVESWWTADYFPTLPFIGYFFLGAATSVFAYPNRQSLLPKLDGKWHTPISFFGKYSLTVYFASQILASLVCFLIAYSITGSFSM